MEVYDKVTVDRTTALLAESTTAVKLALALRKKKFQSQE